MITCPFCQEPEFDAIGLKLHLTVGHCDAYNAVELPTVRFVCSWPQCGCAAGCGWPGEAKRKGRPTAEECEQERAAQLAEDKRDASAERMRGLS